MDRAHEALLMDHLRDVYDYGATRIPYALLKRWFGAERITKKLWTGLEERWQGVLDENKDEGWRLGYADNSRSDDMTLICLDPEGAEESYLKPLEALYKSEANQ